MSATRRSTGVFEQLVLQHVTNDPHVFVSPQYRILAEAGSEWSLPDFVALNVREKTVSVIEVTTADDLSGVVEDVVHRDKQWFSRLKPQLQKDSVVDSSWRYEVQVFVKREAVSRLQEKFAGQSDV